MHKIKLVELIESYANGGNWNLTTKFKIVQFTNMSYRKLMKIAHNAEFVQVNFHEL